MKTFVYRGFAHDGNRRKGVIEAIDLKDAREKLSRGGILAEQIEAVTDRAAASSRWGRGGTLLKQSAARAELYRALAALLRAGLPLASALEIMLDPSAGDESGASRAIAAIRDRIREGDSFARATTGAGAAITGFEEAVIEAGEKTGRLAEVLEQVADYLEDVERIKQTLRSAAIYPAVVLALSFIVVTGMFAFVIPKISVVLSSLGGELPALTRFFVSAGGWFMPVILPVVLMLAITIALIIRQARRDPALRARIERRLIQQRGIGRGYRLLLTTRFARTNALLLGGGLSMVEAVALSGRATGSVWLAGLLEEKSEAIKHGLSLSQAISDIPVLNQSLASWVKAGEASGDIPGMFSHAARRYQLLWTQYVQRAVTIIEPALITVVAVLVLTVALALLLPIFEIDLNRGM